MLRLMTWMIAVLALTPSAWAAEAAPCCPSTHNTLSEQEVADGWVLLFDGKTLDGWRGVVRAEVAPHHWVIEDGVLRKVARDDVPKDAEGKPLPGGDLMTVEQFDDFEFSVDWKISPGGNSGVKYNVKPALQKRSGALGFEFQIVDPNYVPALNPLQYTGSLYDMLPPSDPSFDLEAWNNARIVVRDGRGEHYLNGRKVVEYAFDSPELNAAVAASKFAPIEGWSSHGVGHIVLQDHHDQCEFRNIKVRRIEK